MFIKARGLLLAERTLNAVEEEIYVWEEGRDTGLVFRIEAFNNCREQGLILYVSKDFEVLLTVYVYNHRNTDKLTVAYEDGYGDRLYSEEAWLNQKSFDGVYSASKYVFQLIVDAKDGYEIALRERKRRKENI